MNTECIITGVYLISPDRDEYVAADLFVQGSTLIINTVLYQGDTYWRPIDDESILDNCRCLFLGAEFFERRGIFVMQKEDCELNHEAVGYLMKSGVKL